MKVCKIELVKKYAVQKNGDTRCDNIYPAGYNPYKVNVISYDEEPLIEGDNIGYCIGTVDDGFIFTDKMIEITTEESHSFIESRGKKYAELQDKNKYNTNKKRALDEAGIN